MTRPRRVRVLWEREALVIAERIRQLAYGIASEAIYPDSRALRQLSGRVLEDPDCMVHKAAERLVRSGFGKHLFGGPGMFFLRWVWPGQTYDGENVSESWMHSPGHWDDYGADTLSVWIPLCDVKRETTGTFWWSDREEDIAWWRSQDPVGLRVPWNYHPLAVGGSEPWPDPGVNCEECEAGEALVFDKGLLHGSTRSLTAPRLSYDLRMQR